MNREDARYFAERLGEEAIANINSGDAVSASKFARAAAHLAQLSLNFEEADLI